AAGAAHEINNPLAVIRVNLDLLLDELRRDGSGLGRIAEKLIDLVMDARRGEERIRTIVRGLKTFARMEPAETTRVDVRRVIDVSIDLAFSAIRDRAVLVRELDRVPPVNADETRLSQVIVNL